MSVHKQKNACISIYLNGTYICRTNGTPEQANRNKMKIFSSCVRPKNTEKVNKRQPKIMQANII